MGLRNWFAHSWKLFSRDPTDRPEENLPGGYMGNMYASRPDRVFISAGTQSSILTPLFTKIATDVSQLNIRHCRVGDNEAYEQEIDSYLNDCLKFYPNLDQGPDQLVRDAILTMFEEGVVAIVPTVTDVNINHTNGFDIQEMRVGVIKTWYPADVEVELWNNLSGMKENYILPKKSVAIIENPFYAVMNSPSSTVQRLVNKQAMIDNIDAANSNTNKLNILFQVPFTITNKMQQKKADERLANINEQINNSKYGMAYVDGSEKVIQLNRPAENGLREEIDYLYKRVLNELGISQAIVDGTAEEHVILNYYNGLVEPILNALCKELTRKFTSKTGRTQGQRVLYFKDPFKLVPVNQMADMVDKFSRNEILTGNEIRGFMGIHPSDQESANELRNKNISKPVEKGGEEGQESVDLTKEETSGQNGSKPPKKPSVEASKKGAKTNGKTT